MHVQTGNDYSDFHDDPLRVPDSEREKAPEAEFRWFRKDDRRMATAQRRGYVKCETELPDLVLHRTSQENKQRWHDGVAHRTEAMTNPTLREQGGIRSEGRRRRNSAPPERSPETSPETSPERPDNPTNRTYFT